MIRRIVSAVSGRRLPAVLAAAIAVVVVAGSGVPTPGSGAEATGFTEVSLNLTGGPLRGQTPYGEVRGMFDGHSHMMLSSAFGDEAACGKPWSPAGPADALQDCDHHRVLFGAGSYVFNLLQTGVSGTPTLTHDAGGWPNFGGWPKWNVVLHQQIYHRWLERAWRAGLRVYVMHAAENGGLCRLNAYRTQSCDETQGVIRQIKQTYALQDNIDQRAGGAGKGWFRIVKDPFEARRVINDGKLAVILGVETSELFGCGLRGGVPQCDRDDIDAGLDQMKELGVTTSFVAHKYDNALAGVAMDKEVAGALINSIQFKETGRFWDVETCTGTAHDERQLSVLPNPLGLPPGVLPIYPKGPHCNTRGLSDLGEYFVRGMIRRGMVVETDHLSVRARQQVLNIIEAERYSGLVTSHSWSDPASQPRILRLGGIASPMAGPATTPDTELVQPAGTCCYLDVWRRLRRELGIADDQVLPIGASDDMSGPSPQPTPRQAGIPAVGYPFRTFDGGTVVDRQRTGNKTFDINTTGVAHIGLLPDWWERMRLTGGQQLMDDLAAGAEGYLQMWERAVGVPRGTCADDGRLSALQPGMTPAEVLLAAGQPKSRVGREYRYCEEIVRFDVDGFVQEVRRRTEPPG